MMNLDFTRTEILVLYVFPALVSIFIFLFSYINLEKTKTTLYFMAFALLSGLWQLSDGLMKLSTEAAFAEKWNKVCLSFILGLLPFGIYFILNVAGWRKLAWLKPAPVLLAFATAISFILVELGFARFEIRETSGVYWVANPVSSLPGSLVFIFVGSEALLMLAIAWLFWFKTKQEPLRHKQALALASGLTLPVIGGVLFEIILPLYFQKEAIPVSVPLLSCFSLSSFIAITRYKMLDFSPRHHWSRIISAMNEGVLIVDNNDRIQYANAAFCRQVGYDFKELKGKVAYELLLDQEQRPLIQKVLEERFNRREGQYEISLRAKDGNYVDMLVSGSPYYDQKGRVIGSIGVQTNITKLKEGERQLRHANARLAQSQQVARFGSWEMELPGGKTLWSDEACRIYGLSVSEKTEQTYDSWLKFVHAEDRELVLSEIMKSQLQLSDASFRHRIRLSDGAVKYIHSLVKYEKNDEGKATGLFGVCHDITNQVEAEKALVRSENTMRTFINESLLSICFMEPATKNITYANPAFCRLLGYSPEELKKLTAYDLVNHTRDDVNERIRELMKVNSANFGERQWKNKKGEVVYVTVSSFYHKYNGAEAIYIAAQDITKRKLAENKMKETNDELKAFVYKASHDIRGPLASAIGLISVAKMEVSDTAANRYFYLVDTTLKKLDYTLQELVKAMRITDASHAAEPIDFHSLVNETLKKFEHIPDYRNLKIKTAIAPPEIFFSNRSIVETIIQNLVENAVKYQRRHEKESSLLIDIKEDTGGVMIELKDNGIGIEEQFHDKVFNMYFRANADKEGSGLGLYLVKKGVDKLNGRIHLESRPRAGTTFTIHLPCMGRPCEDLRKESQKQTLNIN